MTPTSSISKASRARVSSERRTKAPPARDVAGFLRSIDYAASAAIERAPNITAEEHPVFADRIRLWGARLSAAYLGLLQGGARRNELWPADEDQARLLINLFQIEKALYEIEYELTNRPAWTHIPLDGAWRILAERGVVQ